MYMQSHYVHMQRDMAGMHLQHYDGGTNPTHYLTSERRRTAEVAARFSRTGLLLQ